MPTGCRVVKTKSAEYPSMESSRGGSTRHAPRILDSSPFRESLDFALVPRPAGCHAKSSSDGCRISRLARDDLGILPQIFRLSIPAVLIGRPNGRHPNQLNADRWERPPDLPSCSRLLFVPSPGQRSSRSPPRRIGPRIRDTRSAIGLCPTRFSLDPPSRPWSDEAPPSPFEIRICLLIR